MLEVDPRDVDEASLLVALDGDEALLAQPDRVRVDRRHRVGVARRLCVATVRDRAGKRGFEDALELASPGQLRELGWYALTLLEEIPDLTLITARAGMDSGDFELLQQSLAWGDGTGLSPAFRMASQKLEQEDVVQLLKKMLKQASDSTAGLAIAHLAPARLEDPAIREILFNTLADQNLGPAAALVLGASPDSEIQTRLREIASEKEGLAQHRAALALSVRQAEGGAEQ